MQIGRSLTSITALLTLTAAVSPMAAAQTGRTWVDPPAQVGPAPTPAPAPQAPQPESPPAQAAPPPPAPSVPPARTAQPQEPVAKPEPPTSAQTEPPPAAKPSAPTVAAQPRQEPESDRRSTRAAAARDFAVEYLESWSASNDVALEATAAFYAPRILFHGREMTMKRLFNEKRRFAQRWPERDYRPRQDAIGATCNPAGEVCTVHAVFDFKATSPKRRRVSQGTGALQLIVNFIGDRPVIVAEHSTLLGQERRGNLAQEGVSHD
ncbi:hypothetical protein MicloDRAFT_00035300 [Microvirga lotononidis]|uniref:DUF4440 domain-containing protein n=2 Tax=Microvirga lotononidis TaxID=864069 RepID=I4YSN5_9HYPH|nr:hypothetical protein MicloDRAFT_00035300 [Microvirga lotononidis]